MRKIINEMFECLKDLWPLYAVLIPIITIILILAETIGVTIDADSDNPHYDGYQTCFTPGQMCEDLIVKNIEESHKSILLQAYQLTSVKIVNALLEKARKGDKIVLILDRTSKEAAIPFAYEGIPVYIDDKVKIAHNKVMIIDDHILITGSFNFTSSAENRNAENLLIIDNQELAHQYKINFYNRLRQSLPLKERIWLN